MRDILATTSPLIGLLIGPVLVLLGGDPLYGSLMILSSIAFSLICVLYETWRRHLILSEHFLKSNYDPNYTNFKVKAQTARKLNLISEQQNANVVVYSGFSPFVGAGIDLGGWSFSLNVHKGKDNLGNCLEPQSFEIRELYDCLIIAVQELNFEGLTIEDKIFVNGKDLKEDQRLLPDPLGVPTPRVDANVIDEFKDKSTHSIRHYTCVRITDWKGELVLSVFLRLTKTGSTFFTEANYFLLTPVAEQYRKVDSMRPSLGIKGTLKMFGVAIVKGLLLWYLSVLILLFKVGRFFYRWSERRNRQRLVEEDPNFDYGASGTLRQYVSSSQYRRYFQKLDKEMYVKTLERLILDRIIQFLDGKNIDTSDLKDRRATILNQGVIVTGGAVQARNFAVGQTATASSLPIP